MDMPNSSYWLPELATLPFTQSNIDGSTGQGNGGQPKVQSEMAYKLCDTSPVELQLDFASKQTVHNAA